MSSKKIWTKESWKNFPILQQPDWSDRDSLNKTIEELSVLPPLVFAGEINELKKNLTSVAEGKAFLLQGGDCSESFAECKAPTIRENLKVLLQMAIILTYTGQKPVIKVGRIAGQYAKPRSSAVETINGIEYPSYRGDMVNRIDIDQELRKPNDRNLLQGYFYAASTLNLLRSFTKGGFASLDNIHKWNLEFTRNLPRGNQYEQLADEINKALSFMKVIGIDRVDPSLVKQVPYFTSHEALLLDYEQAMTRKDSLTGEMFDCSAHMLWIGDRTRHPDEAHVEFCRGIGNPIGIKVGPKTIKNELIRTISTINPENEKGKIILIVRLGADQGQGLFPSIINWIKSEGFEVIWSCDPMHGNTINASGYKTRNFDTIMAEIETFFTICAAENVIPGGIHTEMTGLNVTECLGGSYRVDEEHLKERYNTTCDPRLNAEQSIELSFKLAKLLKKNSS